MTKSVIGVTFMVLAATESQAQAPAKAAADADRQAITRLRDAEIPALASGDPEKLVALYADGIVLLPPNEPAIAGKAAARAWARRFFQQFKVEGTYTSTADLTISGDLAFERLSFKLKLTPVGGGAAMEDAGKGIHVYRREAGAWKIAQDVWNSDRPLAAPK
jgi:ketosteroid isomerase-like protein